jgi:hypothetical protein
VPVKPRSHAQAKRWCALLAVSCRRCHVVSFNPPFCAAPCSVYYSDPIGGGRDSGPFYSRVDLCLLPGLRLASWQQLHRVSSSPERSSAFLNKTGGRHYRVLYPLTAWHPHFWPAWLPQSCSGWADICGGPALGVARSGTAKLNQTYVVVRASGVPLTFSEECKVTQGKGPARRVAEQTGQKTGNIHLGASFAGGAYLSKAESPIRQALEMLLLPARDVGSSEMAARLQPDAVLRHRLGPAAAMVWGVCAPTGSLSGSTATVLVAGDTLRGPIAHKVALAGRRGGEAGAL